MADPSLQTFGSPLEGIQEACLPPRVRLFTPDVAEQWDHFVLQQPAATLFHSLNWKRVIEGTFGYQPCYLYAERGGTITGIVPSFWVSNWVMGRCLLSTPLAVYGGICAADAESEQALLAQLKKLARAEQVDFLELRDRNRGLYSDFHPVSRYAAFAARLSAEVEANWKRLPKDTRYMIRKGKKAGLRSRPGIEQMEDFYRLFAYSMRQLGTPVFPRTLFENLAEEFRDRLDLLMVYSGSKPVAGVLSFTHRDTILPYYAGAGPQARSVAANNFIYWELMKSAAERGFRWFDFGRSKKGTGSYSFKMQWNMEVRELDYQVYLVRGKTVPDISPINPKFELATRVWKRLPLQLANWLGPHVVRWFP